MIYFWKYDLKNKLSVPAHNRCITKENLCQIAILSTLPTERQQLIDTAPE